MKKRYMETLKRGGFGRMIEGTGISFRFLDNPRRDRLSSMRGTESSSLPSIDAIEMSVLEGKDAEHFSARPEVISSPKIPVVLSSAIVVQVLVSERSVFENADTDAVRPLPPKFPCRWPPSHVVSSSSRR